MYYCIGDAEQDVLDCLLRYYNSIPTSLQEHLTLHGMIFDTEYLPQHHDHVSGGVVDGHYIVPVYGKYI